MWLSLVERLLWEQDAAGSNPVIPTSVGAKLTLLRHFFTSKDDEHHLRLVLKATSTRLARSGLILLGYTAFKRPNRLRARILFLTKNLQYLLRITKKQADIL